MSSLDSIVLSLEASRRLVARGILLDTGLVWVHAPLGWINGGGRIPYTAEGGYIDRVQVSGVRMGLLSEVLCPAPVFSELLNAIVKKYPACAFEMLWSDDEWEIDLANDLPQICWGLNGKNHLAALAQLCLRVLP